jgi:hypothetical protein
MYLLKKWLAKKMIARSAREKELPLADLEKKYSDPDNELYNDSSYFNGHGADGSFFVIRQAFRSTRGNEYWLNIHLPDLGTFILKDFYGEEGPGFSQGPLRFECLELGKKWKIDYEGEISKGNDKVPVKLDLEFNATTPLVNFKNAVMPDASSKVIASEKWNREFFQKLREVKIGHTEQGGISKGWMEIDGQKREVEWRGIRDHSWGSRRWSYWKRHCWFGAVFENGDMMNASMIVYDFIDQLSAGFHTMGEHVVSLRETPRMDDFARDPMIVTEGGIPLKFSDGSTREFKWRMYGNFEFLMDKDEYFVFEGMSDVELDGEKGKAVTEFGFNPSHYEIVKPEIMGKYS